MDFKRARLAGTAALLLLAAYACASAAMDTVARWVEVERAGYLWWKEEWMQLFGAHNFVDRGEGRVLLSGASEVREAFLVEDMEAELDGFEVYNNAYSAQTMQMFLLVLEYIETVYGPSAMPEKIVLGVTPRYAFNEPPVEASFFPRVVRRYSPYVAVDLTQQPPRLVAKGWLDSVRSRYRFLSHQARRYEGAVKGVAREVVLNVAPALAGRRWLQDGLAPSWYHHLPPIDKEEQLGELREERGDPPDPLSRTEQFRTDWDRLRVLVDDRGIELYVVNMPQSTVIVEDYYGASYEDYRKMLRDVIGDTPCLDLVRFLPDEQFHDLTHATLAGARLVSRRVARFVRDVDATVREHVTGTPASGERPSCGVGAGGAG